MIKLTPVSITATNQVYAVVITEKLCKPYCESSSIQPAVDVKFQVESSNFVNGTQYAKIKAQGIVTYVPKNANACCPASKIFTEYLTLAFQSTREVAVTIASTDGYVEAANVNCCGVACGISWAGSLSAKIPTAQ